MILFLADNHFGKHPAQMIHGALTEHYGAKVAFFEDDFETFLDVEPETVQLLILHVIGDTSGIAHAGPEVEEWMLRYFRPGKPVLLLHGSSAAFWKWSWWREMVGFRWVRGEDPDGLEASTHPVVPARIYRTKSTHPLVKRLDDFEMPEDELYINLAHAGPAWVLMEASFEGRSHPMLYEGQTTWGGQLVCWIPGHRETTLRHPVFVHNTVQILRYMLGS